jgi:predicted secreted protein
MAASVTVVDGLSCRLYVDISATPTALAGEGTASIAVTMEPKEFTNKDSNHWAEFVVGKRGWTASCEFVWDDADTGQEKVISNLTSNATGTVTFKTLNSKDFEGTGLITGFNITSSQDDVVRMTCDVLGTEAITFS